MSTTHGPLHDEFTATSRDPHGAQQDEGYRDGKPSRAHGKLLDQFAKPPGVDRYGEHWDEFGWKAMPAMHGLRFDSDFSQPAALDGGDHGTWHDVFRGGTQVRYIVNGIDYEGVVENTGSDHVAVRSREGARHELGLGQIKELRWATQSGQGDGRKPVAQPGKTADSAPSSKADAPSAHNTKAHGAGRQQLDATEKTSDDADVEKTVDSTETALQGQGDGGSVEKVGHRANCPKGGSDPCGAEQGGKCSSCGAEVRDHEALGKSTAEVLEDLRKIAATI